MKGGAHLARQLGDWQPCREALILVRERQDGYFREQHTSYGTKRYARLAGVLAGALAVPPPPGGGGGGPSTALLKAGPLFMASPARLPYTLWEA